MVCLRNICINTLHKGDDDDDDDDDDDNNNNNNNNNAYVECKIKGVSGKTKATGLISKYVIRKYLSNMSGE